MYVCKIIKLILYSTCKLFFSSENFAFNEKQMQRENKFVDGQEITSNKKIDKKPKICTLFSKFLVVK